MKFNKRKYMIVVMLILVVATVSLIGLTYAYYRTRVIENTNEKSISVTSKYLAITYADGNGTITAENIIPGFTASKTFTVSNTGDEVVEGYVVFFDDVINEFSRTEDWTYVLICTSLNTETNTESGTCEGSSGTIPVDEAIIVSNDIGVGITHNYELTVSYAITSEDQSDDMGKILSARINIGDKDLEN